MVPQTANDRPRLGIDRAGESVVLRIELARQREVLPDEDATLVANVEEPIAFVDVAAQQRTILQPVSSSSAIAVSRRSASREWYASSGTQLVPKI